MLEIERELDLDMPDLGAAIARPVRFDVRGLERAASASEAGECVAIA